MAAYIDQEALTDELVEIITGYSSIDQALAFEACREAASHNLRHHRFGRTNQFEVRKSLTGLVEKFSILDNDTLAEALEVKLGELKPHEDKWTPEILSFLLVLSNEPVTKTKLEGLNNGIGHEAGKPLTWEDIQADDPREDDAIWDDVDFGADSDDEDVTLRSVASSQRSNESRKSSITDLDVSILAEAYLMPVDESLLQKLVEPGKRAELSEPMVVRETLHMLLGLPTSIYDLDEENDAISPKGKLTLDTLSAVSMQDLVERYTSIGTHMSILRSWSKKNQTVPLLQTFQSCMQDRLRSFEGAISTIEKSFVSLQKAQVVSLVNLESTVQDLAMKLVWMEDIATNVNSMPADQTYRILDDLLDQVSIAQAIDDTAAFANTGDVFFRCLDTYLKPLRTWIEDGELGTSDSPTPFVSRSGVGIADFWQERYALALEEDGTVKTPRFMQDLMSRIFSSGKGVAFMKELGLPLHDVSTYSMAEQEERLSLETVCGSTVEESLLPFEELLQNALNAWVSRKHHNTWHILRKHLLEHGGLLDTVNALSHLYLCKDGSQTNAFAFSIFAILDAGKSRWHDRYFLEDLARSAFTDSSSINTPNIRAVKHRLKTSTSSLQKDRTVKALAIVANSISYTYHQYLHNIITPAAVHVYASASTLLLQLQRPIYLLARKQARSSSGRTRSICRQKALRLRHNLYHNIFAIRSHMLRSVIEPASQKMDTDFEIATDMSSLINAHAIFTTSLKRGCLLSSEVEPVRRAVLSLADLAVSYADMYERWSNTSAEKDTKQSTSDTQDSNSDSGTGEDEEAERKVAKPHFRPLSDEDFTTRLKHMHTQHDQLLGYIVAGLRTAARGVEGEGSWTMLAEVLSWSPVKV